jgi:hypothetical protein
MRRTALLVLLAILLAIAVARVDAGPLIHQLELTSEAKPAKQQCPWGWRWSYHYRKCVRRWLPSPLGS